MEEDIKKLNIPAETLIAEFNRLEDLEDDREQLNDYIKDLQKKLTNAIEIKYINKDYIPKSKVQEILDEYGKQEIEDITVIRFYKAIQNLVQEGDK